MSCPLGVVIFIQESSEYEKLRKLRASLAGNSQKLVELFRERANLAREIGRVKRDAGLPSRIREREEAVLEGLGELDSFSRSIMSSLFEFSITNEHEDERRSAKSLLDGREFTIKGTGEELELLAGLLVSRPGVDFYSERALPETFEEAVQVNGGHIVIGSHMNPDITICLGGNVGGCDFAITRSGEMHFRLKSPVRAGDVIVQVVQP